MQGWDPSAAPGYGWPLHQRSWVNPSPNAPNLSMVRCYAGTVMIEGTTLSEGRGTTRPLEIVGAPKFDALATLKWVEQFSPQWLAGCTPRVCWFEPTFHKHVGELCDGIQFHVDDGAYRYGEFRPWRLMAAIFKAQRTLQPERVLWRDFPYEYELNRLAFNVINGGPRLRHWIEDPRASAADFETVTAPEEHAWYEARVDAVLYRN
jgi:uncharacterized protein YbbC (DUF1343 family)